MASTSKTSKTIKVLTIHNVMGERQVFNNQGYSWIIEAPYITVTRNDQKWHAHFPMANIVEAEVEDVEVSKVQQELKK